MDGVEIHWGNDGPQTYLDIIRFFEFLTDLRNGIRSTEIIVSLSAQIAYVPYFKFQELEKLADHLILQSFQFHQMQDISTGHKSPLYNHSSLFPELSLVRKEKYIF